MRFSSFVSAALVALAPLAAASNLTQLVARDQVVPRVGSGVKMVRGVNLGSWFVLEPWMIVSAMHRIEQLRCEKDNLTSSFVRGSPTSSRLRSRPREPSINGRT